MSSPRALDANCRVIKKAVESLLVEPEQESLLRRQGIATTSVEIPEEQHGANIATSIFSNIDVADLVIVDISPRGNDHDKFSPNVFYELAMVHALGIPCVLVCDTGEVPFYLRMNHIYVVESLTAEAVSAALREPLHKFLLNDPALDLVANPTMDFFGRPIVDISAAAGVAAAYFENLINRALVETGFIGHYENEFQHLITCRPPDIISHTYEEDFQKLGILLEQELGVQLTKKDLPMIDRNSRRGLSGLFVGKVMIDLPTIAYTLAKSPRFRSLESRILKMLKGGEPTPDQQRVLHQASERLLDQFESSLQDLIFHRSKETAFRRTAHSFCTFENLPAKLLELRAV